MSEIGFLFQKMILLVFQRMAGRVENLKAGRSMNQQLKQQKREINASPKPAGGDAEEGWALSHVSKVELIGPLRIAYDHRAAQTFRDSTHDAMFKGMFTVTMKPNPLPLCVPALAAGLPFERQTCFCFCFALNLACSAPHYYRAGSSSFRYC